MPEFLKMTKLVDQHGVPQVQIGGRRVETRLDPLRPPGFEALDQLRFNEQLIRTALDQSQALFDINHHPLHPMQDAGGRLGIRKK